MWGMLGKCKDPGLRSLQSQVNLFDALDTPVLCYCSEVCVLLFRGLVPLSSPGCTIHAGWLHGQQFAPCPNYVYEDCLLKVAMLEGIPLGCQLQLVFRFCLS
jgi:hypothetical protein